MGDGVGTDIVSVPRIGKLICERGSAFLQRWFTPLEIAHCSRKAVPSRHFAARLAAKEAVVKSLPFGWRGPLPWRSVEIVNGAHGAPLVRLSGDLLAAVRRAGVGEVRVSMSHCDEYATAVAVLTLGPVRRPQPAMTTGEWVSTHESMHDWARLPRQPGGGAVDREEIERVLLEWQALRDPNADPDREALRLAILLEDIFGLALSDDDIDLAVLSDANAVERLLSRGGSGL